VSLNLSSLNVCHLAFFASIHLLARPYPCTSCDFLAFLRYFLINFCILQPIFLRLFATLILGKTIKNLQPFLSLPHLQIRQNLLSSIQESKVLILRNDREIQNTTHSRLQSINVFSDKRKISFRYLYADDFSLPEFRPFYKRPYYLHLPFKPILSEVGYIYAKKYLELKGLDIIWGHAALLYSPQMRPCIIFYDLCPPKKSALRQIYLH
jgi:hypothetical protein